MGSIIKFLERYLVPFASKVGAQRHLVAIRDGFVTIMPLILAGSFAVLLNSVIFKPDSLFGKYFYPKGVPFFNDVLIPIMGNVWWGTLAIMALVLVFTIAYKLIQSYGYDGLPGAVISLAAYLALVPQVVSGKTEAGVAWSAWGNFKWEFFNSGNVFAALIIALVSAEIYRFFLDKKLTIKLPDSVPPAVSRAFTAIIPGIVILFFFGLISFLFSKANSDLFTWINQTLQRPMQNFSQGLGFALVYVVLIQIFWFFGLHGGNIMGPITSALYLPALLQNVEGSHNIFTSAFFDSFVHLGGTGATLGLIIAVLWMSKRQEDRAISKLSLPMGIFQINEPVMYGMPVVLNTFLLVPFLIIPPILTIIAYIATAIGLVPVTTVTVPWVTPPVIGAFLACGGSITAALVALVNLVLAIVVYIPFVKAAEKR